MPITSFVNQKDVRAIVKLMRPRERRKLGLPLVVPSRSDRMNLIGTAFDYLLRFELERRARLAIAEKWVAERAVEFMPMLPVDKDRFGKFIEAARDALHRYVASGCPTRQQIGEMAAWSVRLARIDSVYRALVFGDSPFADVPSEDVEELVALLEIVPIDSLIGASLMLNPDLSVSSAFKGDVDLIVGEMLTEIKVSIHDTIRQDSLDQLFGYFLLARKRRAVDPSFPEIKTFAIYLARQGYLWIRPTTLWTDNPNFSTIEAWFFERWRDRDYPPPSITCPPDSETVGPVAKGLPYIEAIKRRVQTQP